MTADASNWIDPADYADSLPPTFWDRPEHFQQVVLRQLQAVRRQLQAEEMARMEQAAPPVPEPPAATVLEAAASMFGQPWQPGVAVQRLPGRDQSELEATAFRAGGQRCSGAPTYTQRVTMQTLGEAAEVLGISVTGVRRLIRARKLPKLAFGRTVRVRSDKVWALARRRRGEVVGLSSPAPVHHDKGVPLAEVAAILRVSERTLRSWSRADPFIFPIEGVGEDAMVRSSLLTTFMVPFQQSQLRQIDHTKHLLGQCTTQEQRKVLREALRVTAPVIPADELRRDDNVYDSDSNHFMWPMKTVARLLGMTVAGAHKHVAAAGIKTEIISGVARVRSDDAIHMAYLRNEKALKAQGRPPIDPEDPNHVDLPTAAKRMGVTVRTVRRWIAAKRLDAVTREDKLWVRADDLVVLFNQIRVQKARTKASQERRKVDSQHGATLTVAHIGNYEAWLRDSRKRQDSKEWIYTRHAAALLAGCRPPTIEALVRAGLIPAMRNGRDVRIRDADLYAAAVFSPKVARLCPNLAPRDDEQRRLFTADYLTLDFAARFLKRPLSNIRSLIRAGHLHSVHFGSVHRIHASEVVGLGRRYLEIDAGRYATLKYKRFSGELTVAEAADRLHVSERTVQRWYRDGTLVGGPAARTKTKERPDGWWMQVSVPINRGGLLLLERHVEAARRARQVSGKVPRDPVTVTRAQVRSGALPQLMPWEQFRVADAG